MTSSHRGLEELFDFALPVVREAGRQALSFYGKGRPSMKFDESLITESEIKVTEYFQEKLNQRFPDHQLFNQDRVGEDYSHEGERYLWIFDPLDGVANFQAGIPVWANALALLENFWPIIGVIHMPVTGDIFHAQAGKKAHWNDKEIQISQQGIINDESLLLTYSRFHQHYHTTFPGKIRNLGCTAAHICYVAMGRADAAIVANESYQGLAAARVIIEAAGGKIFKIDGSEFHLNEYLDDDRIPEQLVVGSEATVAQVCQSLQRIR